MSHIQEQLIETVPKEAQMSDLIEKDIKPFIICWKNKRELCLKNEWKWEKDVSPNRKQKRDVIFSFKKQDEIETLELKSQMT